MITTRMSSLDGYTQGKDRSEIIFLRVEMLTSVVRCPVLPHNLNTDGVLLNSLAVLVRASDVNQ